jgi:hypothetical protein
MPAGAKTYSLLKISRVGRLLIISLLESGEINELFRLGRLTGAGMVSHGRLNTMMDE